MNTVEVQFHWNYFCSLCSRLELTQNFVSHETFRRDDGEIVLKHAKVFSVEFEQILILAAIEFENISKLICRKINASFDEKSGINIISETILSSYPQIIKATVSSDYQILEPLKGWRVEPVVSPNKGIKFSGLAWWQAYNDVKHSGYKEFEKANLENTINAMASLMIMELYFVRCFDEERSARLSQCKYFKSDYEACFFMTRGKELPDFAD